ncbi:MAG TPA: DUF1080 domain-containing protein [Verrucomicrobiae bacterium]|nr:DUF1080 domain-containing protein [Verrucomicrobiae bacterium]
MRYSKLTFIAAAFALLCGCQTRSDLQSSRAESGWTSLFNGKDLSDWTQKGGNAKYFVEDSSIVGETVPETPNSFLCTEKPYGNFILELDFKVDPRLNSGIQIRSECFDYPTNIEWRGKTISIPARRVHGYQVEIDPDYARGRMWTAGIYDEARRLWLYPGQLGGDEKEFSKQGLKIFNTNDWNHIRVVADGPTIKTYLNDVLCARIEDSMTPKGFIALQVHQIGNDKSKAGMQVRFKNIRLKKISPTQTKSEPMPNTLTEKEKRDGWRLLWDGKTTDGWRSARGGDFPHKSWKIQNGVLSVLSSGNAESQAGGDIITDERYSNFELKVDFKTTPGCNSGIKYFVQPALAPITGSGQKAAVGSAIGLEYQILDDARHPDAKLGRNGDRTLGSLYDLIPASKNKHPNAIGEWNHARIIVRGNHVEHWLNGEKIVEYERGSPEFRKLVAESKYHNIPNFGEWADGHILLQEHGSDVSFRNIKIRLLPGK